MPETEFRCPFCKNDSFLLVKRGFITQIDESRKLSFKWKSLNDVVICENCRKLQGINPSN